MKPFFYIATMNSYPPLGFLQRMTNMAAVNNIAQTALHVSVSGKNDNRLSIPMLIFSCSFIHSFTHSFTHSSIQIAATRSRSGVYKLLVDLGVNVNAVDTIGRTGTVIFPDREK